jgi:hypothetical protein
VRAHALALALACVFVYVPCGTSLMEVVVHAGPEMSGSLVVGFSSTDFKTSSRLPPGFVCREVRACHRKPCTMCGSSAWCFGDYYICNALQPIGTDKICMSCADVWLHEQEETARIRFAKETLDRSNGGAQ